MVPFFGAESFTPARRAFDNPMAMACLAERAREGKSPLPWTDKHGKGVYEIHVRKDGTVSDVKILHQSGDEIFDRTTVDTLRNWRFRRGPLIVELPLAFSLTPTHYSVGISKAH